MRYSGIASEVLIRELLKAGAVRDLQAKVFGGGAVLSAMQQMNIGERNGQFVLNYLRTEGIPVQAQDLGGVHARRINFFPRDGRVARDGAQDGAAPTSAPKRSSPKREQAAAEKRAGQDPGPPRD